MILFGIFLWLCWTLVVLAVFLPIQERLKEEAMLAAIAKELAEQQEMRRQQQKVNYWHSYGWW